MAASAVREDGSKRQDARPKMTLRKIYYSDFTVHVVTWNVASFMPGAPEIESLFLPQEGFMMTNLYSASDLLVVGLQEAYQNVQEALSSSIPMVGKDPHVEAFSSHLACKGFARLAFCRLLGIVVMVFVKQPLLCYIHGVCTCTTKTGFSGWVGNKGAVSVRFTLGDLAMCFTNCHLAPHNESNEKRVIELKDIFGSQVFESGQLALTKLLDHDVVVLFGDLNFRLEQKDFEEISQLLEEGKMKELLKLDQLRIEQIKGDDSPSKLCYFMEMPINFVPSYKYMPNTDVLNDGGKGRAPAWCDRILWRMHHRRLPKMTDWEPRPVVQQDYYRLHKQPRSSDHKAVSAGLKVSIDISGFNPPIVFQLSEWICGVRGTIEFMVTEGTEVSMWDWVGLYPAQFSSLDKDSVVWVLTPAQRGRTPQNRVYSRALTVEQLQINSGKYILVYKSYYYDRVLGMSPIFRILPPDN